MPDSPVGRRRRSGGVGGERQGAGGDEADSRSGRKPARAVALKNSAREPTIAATMSSSGNHWRP